nr:uncharacterized protein LOC109149920 [Ipomoea batatas]
MSSSSRPIDEVYASLSLDDDDDGGGVEFGVDDVVGEVKGLEFAAVGRLLSDHPFEFPIVRDTMEGVWRPGKDTAKEVWDDLKERFCEEDVFRISDVQAEIYNIKQGDLSERQIFYGGLGALVLANGEEVVQSAFLARTTQAGNINMGASATQRKIDIPSPINQPTSHIPREQLNTPLHDKLPSTVAVGDINRRANASFTSFKPNVQDGKHFVSCQSLTWIINTGATDHIVNNVTCFLDSNEVREIYVMLPYGNRAMVTHVGCVRLSMNIILQGVLCVPQFEFNLISVSKLTKNMGCSLVFHANGCEIQAARDRKMIGLAEE